MSGFNQFERKLANILSKFPVVKKTVKRLYSFLNYLRYKKNYSYMSKNSPVQYGVEKESFFGYYDKSPLSQTGEYLLYQQSAVTKQAPAISNAQLVCESNTKVILYSADIKAFNWQQGCKLQWLSDTTFIYLSLIHI